MSLELCEFVQLFLAGTQCGELANLRLAPSPVSGAVTVLLNGPSLESTPASRIVDLEQMMADLILMVSNCKSFNDKETDYHDAALQMEAMMCH